MENELKKDLTYEAERPLTKRERRELAKQEKLKERQKTDTNLKFKKWIVRFIVLIVVGFGAYKIWQWINTSQPGDTKIDILNVRSDDWVKGSPEAKVTLIEYADFECPACKIYSTDILKKLADEYQGNLREVYRHFPLPQHTKAVDAAKAAEAAGVQGKFWEMHDLLYEKQEDWVTGNLKDKLFGYAESLGLDKAQFEKDSASDSVLKSIKDDENDGYSLKINSTPSFYINGKKVEIKNGYEDLKKAIDQALAQG
jgi:protein-disulfide isomerase